MGPALTPAAAIPVGGCRRVPPAQPFTALYIYDVSALSLFISVNTRLLLSLLIQPLYEPHGSSLLKLTACCCRKALVLKPPPPSFTGCPPALIWRVLKTAAVFRLSTDFPIL